jgi:hypothetical protein
MKMETTHVSETSTLYNHTPGNYPKEDNIRSQHGESLKTRNVALLLLGDLCNFNNDVKARSDILNEILCPHTALALTLTM